jgi:hypothetical protein
MPIGQKEHVFPLAIHAEAGIVLHQVEVEGDEVLRASQGAPGVAGLAVIYLANYVAPNLRAKILKVFYVWLRHLVSLDGEGAMEI